MFDLEDCRRNHFLLLVPFFGTNNWRRLWENDTKSHDDLPIKKGEEFLYDHSSYCLSVLFYLFWNYHCYIIEGENC